MSLHAYYRRAYRAQGTIEVEAPWQPGGTTYTLRIRPDYDSEWAEARARLEVDEPLSLVERQKLEMEATAERRRHEAKEIRKGAAVKGRRGADPNAAAITKMAEVLDDLADKISGIPTEAEIAQDGWDLRYPVYLREEIEALAVAVGEHLVEGITVRAEDGEEREYTREEIAETFAETAPLPVAFPDEPDDQVPFAGCPEGVAWSTIVLRAAVQTHVFLEAEGPLRSGSKGPAPSQDTGEPGKTHLRIAQHA